MAASQATLRQWDDTVHIHPYCGTPHIQGSGKSQHYGTNAPLHYRSATVDIRCAWDIASGAPSGLGHGQRGFGSFESFDSFLRAGAFDSFLWRLDKGRGEEMFLFAEVED